MSVNRAQSARHYYVKWLTLLNSWHIPTPKVVLQKVSLGMPGLISRIAIDLTVSLFIGELSAIIQDPSPQISLFIWYLSDLKGETAEQDGNEWAAWKWMKERSGPDIIFWLATVKSKWLLSVHDKKISKKKKREKKMIFMSILQGEPYWSYCNPC
jgi:hypothetical protein